MPPSETTAPGIVAQTLDSLVSQIPDSAEKVSPDPEARARVITKSAALKAAALSGTFTLPPGPFGLATVLPDLLAVWRIQQQLVADIAATYGRTAALTRETMLLSLFKHGAAALTQHILVLGRRHDEVVVHRIAHRALQQLLEKIAVRVGQRIAAKSVSRWLPVVGALGAGAYAYYDTLHVAANARELFSRPLQLAGPADEPADSPDEPAPSSRRAHTRAKPRHKRTGSPSTPRKRPRRSPRAD